MSESPPWASWAGERRSRSKSSSLRPNQSAPPFLGWMGLEAPGGLSLEPCSPLVSGPPSAKNLLQDKESGVRQGRQLSQQPLASLSLCAGGTVRPTAGSP